VVRYGNVMGSRGSVIPFFNQVKVNGFIPITDERMTRFMISLDQGVDLVWTALEDMIGGEIYVKKIPSMKLIDLGAIVAPGVEQRIVGIRPGEKLHEQMIGTEDAVSTYEYEDYFKILPVINNWDNDPKRIKNGKKVPDDFQYMSNSNPEWMTEEDLITWLSQNEQKLGDL